MDTKSNNQLQTIKSSQRLQKVSQELTQSKTSSKELSVFEAGARVSPDAIAVSCKKLSIAFPELNKIDGFYNLLSEMIVKSGMTNERLQYAIDDCISTFQYRQPSIADIINRDISVKLYSFDDIYNQYHMFPHPDFVKILRQGKSFYIQETDSVRWNIPYEI